METYNGPSARADTLRDLFIPNHPGGIVLKHRKSLSFRRRGERGAEAGTLTAPHGSVATSLNVIAYSQGQLIEKSGVTLEDIVELRGRYKVLWINVVGYRDLHTIEDIGRYFDLHGLALEDVLNGHQRPKCEEFEKNIFLISRMVELGGHIDTKQVSMFLGEDYVLTFQAFPVDCLDPVRKRIRESRGATRRNGADYLCYAILDTILDDYFPVLEEISDRLASIEDHVISHPRQKHVRQLHDMKRDLLVLRRSVWPHREMINSIIREEHSLFSDSTRVYLRDGYDHTVQLMDIVEIYREVASGLSDVYISSMSAKMNDIMKVLTIIATVFMPLSFITGLYGMNFDRKSPWNMPELSWSFGYLWSLGLMAASVAGMIWYFYRKKWIGLSWLTGR